MSPQDLQERTAWAAYFAAREALLNHPDVRLFTRPADPTIHGPCRLVRVVAQWTLAGGLPMAATYLVSVGNYAEPGILAHQARALLRTIEGDHLTGAEHAVGVKVGRGRR